MEHLDGGRKLSAGLLRSANHSVQLAEAEVAASLEGTHFQFFGQRQRLAIAGLGLVGVWRLTTRRDLTQQEKSIGLIASLLVDDSRAERSLCELERLVSVTNGEMSSAQRDASEGDLAGPAHRD